MIQRKDEANMNITKPKPFTKSRRQRKHGTGGQQMLICTCPIDEDCIALGSHCDCFPWCDYLKEDDDRDGGLVEED